MHREQVLRLSCVASAWAIQRLTSWSHAATMAFVAHVPCYWPVAQYRTIQNVHCAVLISRATPKHHHNHNSQLQRLLCLPGVAAPLLRLTVMGQT